MLSALLTIVLHDLVFPKGIGAAIDIVTARINGMHMIDSRCKGIKYDSEAKLQILNARVFMQTKQLSFTIILAIAFGHSYTNS